MWNLQPNRSTYAGVPPPGFLPPINNRYPQRNVPGYYHGGPYNNQNTGYYQQYNAAYHMTPSGQYNQNHSNYMQHIDTSRNYGIQSNGPYSSRPNGANYNSGVVNNDFMGQQPRRNGGFNYSNMTRNSSWMQPCSQSQRNVSFYGSQLERNGSFMGPSNQLQRNESFMGPSNQLQRNGSFMGSSNQLQRNDSSTGFSSARMGSFNTSSVEPFNGYSAFGGFGSFYASNQNQVEHNRLPPPTDQADRQGVASLVRKQSVLHKGEVLENENQSIGRSRGSLTFKGVEDI